MNPIIYFFQDFSKSYIIKLLKSSIFKNQIESYDCNHTIISLINILLTSTGNPLVRVIWRSNHHFFIYLQHKHIVKSPKFSGAFGARFSITLYRIFDISVWPLYHIYDIMIKPLYRIYDIMIWPLYRIYDITVRPPHFKIHVRYNDYIVYTI